MMKTGYSPVSHDECEELENYCSKYHIRSGRWKKPFVYGMQEEGEEKLNRLNQLRGDGGCVYPPRGGTLSRPKNGEGKDGSALSVSDTDRSDAAEDRCGQSGTGRGG